MTATANGLHQRRAAGEQKECNKGMMQRKTGATTLAAPGGGCGSIRNMLQARLLPIF